MTVRDGLCPQALPIMCGETARRLFPDLSKINARQSDMLLTECVHKEGHRGWHRSADGREKWTGKLTQEEAEVADHLRAVLTAGAHVPVTAGAGGDGAVL